MYILGRLKRNYSYDSVNTCYVTVIGIIGLNFFLCNLFLLIVVSIYYYQLCSISRPWNRSNAVFLRRDDAWTRSSDNDTRQPTLDMLLLHRSANAWHLSLSWFCFRKFKLDFYSIFEFDFVNFFFLVGQTLLIWTQPASLWRNKYWMSKDFKQRLKR